MSFILKRVVPFYYTKPPQQADDQNNDEASPPLSKAERHDYPVRRLSAAPELSLSDNATPLIPERFARVVSTLSRGSTITLRLGTYVMASLLDSARIGTLTSLSVTCGAIESILLKAEHDTEITNNAHLPSAAPSGPPSTTTLTSQKSQQNDIFSLNSPPTQNNVPESAETMTSSSLNAVNRVATIAQLFTAASFHLASSSLQTASGIAQDTLHVLDAIFGSTESSRALAAIISLVRREFGDGSGIYSLVTGLTCFTILQSRGWGRTVDEIEMFIVWDVVVLDTGETLSQQFPSTSDSSHKESEEDSIIAAIPHNSQYKVAINEVKTKTYSIDVLSETPISSVKLPEGAIIIHREFVPAKVPGEKAKYTITFQTTSKYYRERKGVLTKDDQQNGIQVSTADFIPDPTNVSITTRAPSPELPDNYDDEPPSSICDRRYSFNNPLVLENLLADEQTDSESDTEIKGTFNNDSTDEESQPSSRSSIYNDKLDKPTKHSESLAQSDYSIAQAQNSHAMDSLPLTSPSPTDATNSFDSEKRNSTSSASLASISKQHNISPGNINRRSLTHLSSLAKSSSQNSLKQTNSQSPSSTRSPSHSGSRSNLKDSSSQHQGYDSLRYMNGPRHLSRTSAIGGNQVTLDNKLAQMNALSAATANNTAPMVQAATTPLENSVSSINGKPQNVKKFPPGHITQNMAKYMRFATASYGQSFMSVLGMGKYYSSYNNYDGASSHHSEHYAFAHHTRLNLDDILLSSYSDSAVDDKAGIPLVHFVAIDHGAKAVVLTIRGTLGIEDILTDLTCDYETMQWCGKEWKAHGGMLRCAQILKRRTSRVLTTIRQALEKWGDEYGLVICGHSLGGGVGAILGILLSEIRPDGVFVTAQNSDADQASNTGLPPGRRIHCFAYGPPASISEELRQETRDFITTVIYGLDIVPCLSLGVLRDFQNVALAFKNDQEGIAADIRKRFIAQFASRHIPLSVHDSDDDYLWELLTKLRGVMRSEKLVPPGEVYHISTNTVFETHDGKTKRATRIIAKVIVDVQKRFGEPVFGRGIFHHSPVYYERATRTLDMGVCNAPV